MADPSIEHVKISVQDLTSILKTAARCSRWYRSYCLQADFSPDKFCHECERGPFPEGHAYAKTYRKLKKALDEKIARRGPVKYKFWHVSHKPAVDQKGRNWSEYESSKEAHEAAQDYRDDKYEDVQVLRVTVRAKKKVGT